MVIERPYFDHGNFGELVPYGTCILYFSSDSRYFPFAVTGPANLLGPGNPYGTIMTGQLCDCTAVIAQLFDWIAVTGQL